MKKSILKTTLVMFVCVFMGFGTAFAAAVAEIANYRDFVWGGEGNMTIIRASGNPKGADERLYPGDQIVGEQVGEVRVNCGPYTRCDSETSYVVVYDPPSDPFQVMKAFLYDWFIDYRPNVEYWVEGISRGFECKNLNPRPGNDVTLLPTQKTVFSWDVPSRVTSGQNTTGEKGTKEDWQEIAEAKTLVIKDTNDKEVLRLDIAGRESVEIIPAERKLKSGQPYRWEIHRVDGKVKTCKFTVLDEQFEKELLELFAAMDRENKDVNECALRKAAYVQFISDMYNDKIDLYWLSGQMLLSVEPSEDALADWHKKMLLRCVDHLNSKI